MAASLLDMEVLSTDAAFQNRVQSAIIQTAQAIASESPTATPFHDQRKTLASQIYNSPNGNPNYKALFSVSVATDTTVSGQASTGVAGVPITSVNAAAAAAAVTDTAISNAVSAQWNTYIPGI